MEISYLAGGQHHDAYADAVRTGFDVWLVVNGEPYMQLPDSFDRRVIVEGREIISQVLGGRELVGTDLHPYAGVLTIDIENEEIEWEPPNPSDR